MRATALIAEDEPLLARELQAQLAAAWPDLKIASVAGDGATAVEQALRLRPDVIFLDIRMPRMDGIEAAAEMAVQWDGSAGPLPCIVFITAYEAYAVQAFERQAFDYLLKPLQPQRLQQTVARLTARLAERAATTSTQLLDQLRAIASAPPAAAPAAPLRMLQASVSGPKGMILQMVPVADVLYFKAADKYVQVLTASGEFWIRTTIRELVPQLDPQRFWQVHRGTIVRSDAIEGVSRDEAGYLHLHLRGHPGTLAVSRLYAHLFRAT